MLDRAAFLDAMRRAATCVTVVTTNGPAGRAGLTVSAMCSVSADPPRLLICVHHRSPAAESIRRNGGFCVNLLAESQQTVAEWFAGRRPPEADKFDCAEWEEIPGCGSALVGALASFACRLDTATRIGTHEVLVGEPIAILCAEGTPLIYSDRRFGRPMLDESCARPH